MRSLYGIALLLASILTGQAPFAAASAQQTTKDASIKTAEAPEAFKPLLGKWKVDSPSQPMKWEILSIAEDGSASISYFYKDFQVKQMKAVVSIQNGKPHLSLAGGDLTLTTFELDYETTFGGMLHGKAAARGGSMNVKVYRGW